MTAGFGSVEQRFQFAHNLGPFEVKVVRFTRIGFEIVELAGRVGRGVGEDERLEAGIVLVAVSAGAGAVEEFPRAATDGERAGPRSAEPTYSCGKRRRPPPSQSSGSLRRSGHHFATCAGLRR